MQCVLIITGRKSPSCGIWNGAIRFLPCGLLYFWISKAPVKRSQNFTQRASDIYGVKHPIMLEADFLCWVNGGWSLIPSKYWPDTNSTFLLFSPCRVPVTFVWQRPWQMESQPTSHESQPASHTSYPCILPVVTTFVWLFIDIQFHKIITKTH